MADETRPIPLTPVNSQTPPPQIIVQQRSSMFGRFGKWLLAALVIAVLFIISLYNSYHNYFSPSDMPQEKYHSLARLATRKVAIVDISGTIMEGEDSFAAKQIERVRDDPDVVGIVLRIS